ncbi:hypothetical protein [Desulfitobacterium hafniense]|nr:hypothetical protein [Desulfitobacterium hafniense]
MIHPQQPRLLNSPGCSTPRSIQGAGCVFLIISITMFSFTVIGYSH